MAVERYDFEPHKRGDTFEAVTLSYFNLDEQGVEIGPRDLSGCTVKMQVRGTRDSGRVVLEFATPSTITVSQNQIILHERSGEEMNIAGGKYFYDIEITYPSGKRETMPEGMFPIENDISR